MEPTATTTSFGADLPDQYSAISETITAHVTLASDVATFLAERAALEREYAAKLQGLTRKVKEKREKRLITCTIGPDPSKAWSSDAECRSSLQSYLASIVSTSDGVATDHVKLAEGLDKVAADINTVARRGAEMRNKHNNFYDKTIATRESVYSDRAKAKSKYDEHCHDTDSHRQKKERAEAEGKHVDRAVKSHAEAQAEMFDAKNTYLVSTSSATRAKQRFFREDLPRLQDDLQSLWILVDHRLMGHVQTASQQMAEHSETLAAKHRKMQASADGVDLTSDQALYVDYNVRRYDEPADFDFEPCQGFFDTSEPATEPSAKVFLQNMLIRKRQQMSEMIPLVNSKAKEIQGLENLRDAYLKQKGLGDPEEVTDNLLESVRSAIVVEAQLSLLEAEVQTISDALGGDLGDARPHRFKATKFALPSTCQYCEGKVFGLNGLVCQPCGFVCHPKCEPKVPATCRAAPAQKQTLPDLDTSSRRTSLHRSSTTKTNHSAASSASATASASRPVSSQPARRTLPPAGGSAGTRSSTGSALTASQRRILEAAGITADGDEGSSSSQVKALYGYEATSADEVSITEDEILDVVESEQDGSGWMKVRSSGGNTGLVPANYVEPHASTTNSRKTAPDRFKEADQVRALYDYNAEDEGELSIAVDQLLHLTDRGFSYGSGWCEGLDPKTGQVGIFPSEYVKRV